MPPLLHPGRGYSSRQVVTTYRAAVRGLRELHAACELEEHEAIALLQRFDYWRGDETLGEVVTVEGVRKLREDAEVVLVPPSSFSAEGKFCSIDLELQSGTSGVVLRCGHSFNRVSLKSYVRSCMLSPDGELPVRCPLHVDKCPLVLSVEETIDVVSLGEPAFLMSPEGIDLEMKLVAKLASRVAPSMGLRHCVSCPMYTVVSAQERPHVTCASCGAVFCGNCSTAPHLPLSCGLARQHDDWMRFIESMTRSAYELTADGKASSGMDGGGGVEVVAGDASRSEQEDTMLRDFSDALTSLMRHAARRGDEEDRDVLEEEEEEGGGVESAAGGGGGLEGVEDQGAAVVAGGDAMDVVDVLAEETKEESSPAPLEEAADTPPTTREYDVRAETKPCPACGEPYEKTGGCSHYTCRVCKWQFCWICLKPWVGHSVCQQNTDIGGYDFSQELEHYRRHVSSSGGSTRQGLPAIPSRQQEQQSAAMRAVTVDSEEFRARRREQVREVQEHYVGSVERENTRLASMRHYRFVPFDQFSSLLNNYDAVCTGLVTRLQIARDARRPDFEGLASMLYRAARTIRYVPGLTSSLARAFERMALALAGVDERRGGLSRERLLEEGARAMREEVAMMTMQGNLPHALHNPHAEQPAQPQQQQQQDNRAIPGTRALTQRVMGRWEEVERLCVRIMLAEAHQAPAAAPRTEPTRAEADDRPEHFELVLSISYAWRDLGDHLNANWDNLVARSAALNRGGEGDGPPGAPDMAPLDMDWGDPRFARIMLERERMEAIWRLRQEERHQARRERVWVRERERDRQTRLVPPAGPFESLLQPPVPPPPPPPQPQRPQPPRQQEQRSQPQIPVSPPPSMPQASFASQLQQPPAPAPRQHYQHSRSAMMTPTPPLPPPPVQHPGGSFPRWRQDPPQQQQRPPSSLQQTQQEQQRHPSRQNRMLSAVDFNPFYDWEMEEEELVLTRFDRLDPMRRAEARWRMNAAQRAATLQERRRRLHAFAASLGIAEEAVNDAARAEFRDLLGVDVPSQASALRVYAAIREAKRRRVYAIKRILEKLLGWAQESGTPGLVGAAGATPAEVQEQREQLLMRHYMQWRRSTMDGDTDLLYFRALDLLVQLGVLTLPSEMQNLPARLAYIHLVLYMTTNSTARSSAPPSRGTSSGPAEQMEGPSSRASLWAGNIREDLLTLLHALNPSA